MKVNLLENRVRFCCTVYEHDVFNELLLKIECLRCKDDFLQNYQFNFDVLHTKCAPMCNRYILKTSFICAGRLVRLLSPFYVTFIVYLTEIACSVSF